MAMAENAPPQTSAAKRGKTNKGLRIIDCDDLDSVYDGSDDEVSKPISTQSRGDAQVLDALLAACFQGCGLKKAHEKRTPNIPAR